MRDTHIYWGQLIITCLVSACIRLPKVSLTDTQEIVQQYCSIGGEPDKPFVAGWAADERLDLLRLKTRGAVLLSYKGCIMKVLSHCYMKGNYERNITTPDRKMIEIADRGTLYSQLPMGARSLSAKVEGGHKLLLSYVMNATDSFMDTVSYDHLLGRNCQDATHYVEVMYLGAFRLREIVKANGGIDLLTGGGQLSTSVSHLDEIGNIDRCYGDDANRSCLGVIKIKVNSLVSSTSRHKNARQPLQGKRVRHKLQSSEKKQSYKNKVNRVPKRNIDLMDNKKLIFEEKVKSITKKKLEKMEHEKSVQKAWMQVTLAKADAVKQRELVTNFISRYRDHELGNFKEVEALLLKRKLEQEIEKNRRALLLEEHLKRVSIKLDEVKTRLNQGGDVGRIALKLFLTEYEGHELGNPLASEAKKLLQSANSRRLKQHEDEVRQAWQKISGLLEGQDGIEVVELFLNRFKGHELGNPLENEAREVLSRLKHNESAKGVTVESSSISDRTSNSVDWDTIGMKAILIPGGSFIMGSNEGDDDEKPLHRVTMSSFYLSKTEVTVRQYRACVQAGVCSERGLTQSDWQDESKCNWGKSNREDHPINCVNWNQARTFAKWAGGDLPTEAQWEYAARSAGKKWIYPWGNNKATCNYALMYGHGSDGCGKDRTWTVCSKPRGNTKQGVCDMAGNIYEWVRDAYQDHYKHAPTNGSEVCSTSICKRSEARVTRGGGWRYNARYLRTADRGYYDRSGHLSILGFRVILVYLGEQ